MLYYKCNVYAFVLHKSVNSNMRRILGGGTMAKKSLKISFNSPVVIIFSLICLIALILGIITGGATNKLFFSVYRASFSDVLTYVRFIGHIFGHSGFEHFIGNIMLILVIGPLLEEKYGGANIVCVIAATALVTGIVNFIFFPDVMLLGASGVVFAFILLSSFTCVKEGEIPVTFLLVAVIYIGQQIYQGIFVNDNISNLTHILGGIVGAAFGYILNKKRIKANGY